MSNVYNTQCRKCNKELMRYLAKQRVNVIILMGSWNYEKVSKV